MRGFAQADGLALIDGGWAVPEALKALESALAVLEPDPGEIRHVLVTHIHRERPVYALTIAKGGPKLKESAPKPQIEDPSDSSSETEGSLSFTSTHMTATNVTMAIFASMLSHLEDVNERVVVDKTGLTKHYDWELSWSPDAAQDTTKASLFTAVQEQLGLKLEQDKAPIDIVVIDHLERPTEN